MPLSNEELKKYTNRLLLSRFRILNKNGFFGLLLLRMKMGLDLECETAYTNGTSIKFSPDFMDSLSDSQLDFVLMHEIMHVVLDHCYRGRNLDNYLFNIACDIVVNSNIKHLNNDDDSSISITNSFDVAMHLAPDGKEGYNYTAEEVYQMIINKGLQQLRKQSGSPSNNNKGELGNTLDDHNHWNDKDDKAKEDDKEEWGQVILGAYESAKLAGAEIPEIIDRSIKELKNPTVNWKHLLHDFLSFEINDYSFNPPDKRYDGDFYLPDFNELEEMKLCIAFYCDTSGSITDDILKATLSEIKGALESYDGKVKGYLSYFDTRVFGPYEVNDINDLFKAKPEGGGGTDFNIIFKSLDNLKEKIEEEVKAVVILTDGFAVFPEEDAAKQTPVLWLINNDKVTPPWGIVARYK